MAGLKDKVVIITGASSGIGAASAVEFASHGANVVLTARDLPRLEETSAKCQLQGLQQTNILIVVADLLKDDDIHKIVINTLAQFGQIDILVNNAGYPCVKTMMTSTVEDVDDMYNMNVRSVYLLTKLAVPHIINTKGNIVNVSSVVSSRPVAAVLPYCMARAAQDQMMRCLSLELGPSGVRINSVCPGIIRRTRVKGLGDPEKFYEAMKTVQPLGRVGQPVEVAKVIVFLASDDASFMSGATVPVDGAKHNTSQMPAPTPE